MNFKKLFQYWCDFTDDSKTMIITDSGQIEIANEFKKDFGNRRETKNFLQSEQLIYKNSFKYQL